MEKKEGKQGKEGKVDEEEGGKVEKNNIKRFLCYLFIWKKIY